MKEPSFQEEVVSFWGGIHVTQLIPKLLYVSSFMAKWGHNFFHKFRDKVKKQKEVLDVLAKRVDDEGIRDYFAAKD